MPPLRLKDATGSTACVAAHLGFNCYQFRPLVNGQVVDVLDAPEGFAEGNERPSGYGIPLLFPFPNRIRGGRYVWDGRAYDLNGSGAAFDQMGNAIHGFCLDRPWRVVAQSENQATGCFQLSVEAPDRSNLWPADFVIEARYAVRGRRLRLDVRISNPDDRPLPWGFGTHPYFRLPLAETSDPGQCVISAPASEEWELADFLPTGTRRPVPPEKDLRDGVYFDTVTLDDVLTGLPAADSVVEHTIVDEKAGLQVVERCDPLFRELVAYTPPGRNAVCLEPYTCVTDAINLSARGVESGWRVLEPGAEIRTWIEIEAGRVIA